MGETNISLCETHIIGQQTRERSVGHHTCAPLTLYGIRFTGLSQAAAPFQFVRRQPRSSQVLACVSGRGEVWLEGEWVPCGPGEAYVTPAGPAHGYRAVGGGRWRLAWVIYAHGPQAGTGLSHDRPSLIRLDPRPLSDAIEGLYRESMGMGEATVMHHWAHLVHIYAQRALGPESADARLRTLWERVDAHLAHPWTVEEMAREAGMSGEHLRRLCRQHQGHSPMRHVAHLRMHRAAALLSTESYTVETVAQQVGYENPFAFSTAFKRHTGLPPSEYRGEKDVPNSARIPTPSR